MQITEHMHKDIEEIKNELALIRAILEEDFELSAEAKIQLEGARKTPVSDYLDNEKVKKELLKK